MDQRFVDLNGYPFEDGAVQYVMLQMDNKPICRTKCCNLPFQTPSVWVVSNFRPNKTYLEGKFPMCQLYPSTDIPQQKEEWGKFMHYLRNRKKVAVARTENCSFYILASDESPEISHAIVPYNIRKPIKPNAAFVRKSAQDSDAGDHCFKDPNRHAGEGIRESEADTSTGQLSDEVESANQHPVPRRDVHTQIVRLREVPKKNYIKTDPSYLRTLSQTHNGWIFGAIAELIDNSRDANAYRLDISIQSLFSKRVGKRVPVFSVIDNGCGMTHVDIERMLSFGCKQPDKDDRDHIGRFGIGFKTGAMKLGRDVLVLTQTTNSRSVAFLSQSFNQNKENLEIPIVTYCKQGNYMEVDLSIQSEASASYHLNAIKEFSPFNEYFIGEKLGLFGENGTGTQVYIWNLDEWGSTYTLEWTTVKGTENPEYGQGNILIRSRRLRSRPGQVSQKVPLDYSLQAYLEVIFLDPRMKIYVQGSLVRSRPLAKSLNKTVVVRGHVMGKILELVLGRSSEDWEQMNAGIFLYWHGRLIEAYKRVGGMIHNADMGRGVLGVIHVTNLMDTGNGQVWVLNNKQGFQDCEAYAKLEEWLGQKADEYWDENFDKLPLTKAKPNYKPDHDWVQCNKCRKWRILSVDFDNEKLPLEWFCYMAPYNGKCETPEQPIDRGVITIGAKRTGYDCGESVVQNDEKKVKFTSPKRTQPGNRRTCNVQQKIHVDNHIQNFKTRSTTGHERANGSGVTTATKFNKEVPDVCGEISADAGDPTYKPIHLKRIRRGP